MYIYVYVYIYICIYMYINIYICIYIYIYSVSVDGVGVAKVRIVLQKDATFSINSVPRGRTFLALCRAWHNRWPESHDFLITGKQHVCQWVSVSHCCYLCQSVATANTRQAVIKLGQRSAASTTVELMIKIDTLADFKYGVTFNTHGNTNGSVNPSHSTQCKMLTSRPTEMLAMKLHF